MSQAPHPNIVFILADDMGYGDVGCYNPESKIPTPNMDKLAEEGMIFTDAHSPSAVCTPTRYGLLTGRYCWRTSLKKGVLYGYEPPLIETDRMTVGKLLQNAGYHTACIGKWHLGLGYTPKEGRQLDFDRPLPWGNATRDFEEKVDFSKPLFGGPNALGFDYFFGCSGCPTCQPPYGFIENERFVVEPDFYDAEPAFTSRKGMTAPGWEHYKADPAFADKAHEYIHERAESDQPFFLYLAPSAPHEPCVEGVVPPFARGKSDAGPRGDLVWLVDWMVGRVMTALEETGQTENTLIIASSDNGALPGDRIRGQQGMAGYNTYGHKSCGDWRGYKAHIWEGGHREPFIARWPGRIEAGSSCGHLACLTDFISACADIVDQPLPDGAAEDSESLLPALLHGDAADPIRSDLIHHSSNGVFSIREGEWKLIVGTEGSGGWPPPSGGGPQEGTPGQLYHIENDPQESENLWAERPEMVARLARLLETRQG